MNCRWFSVLVLVVLILPGRAADPRKSARQTTWTVADIVEAESASAFRFSPDGKYVVWIKETADKDRGEKVGNLMRTSLGEEREVALTRGSDPCREPRWSPDGKLLAFLTSRPLPKKKDEATHSGRQPHRRAAKSEDEDRFQIWLLDPTGGEPWPLTDFPRSIEHLEWAGSNALVFVAKEEADYQEKSTEDKKDTSEVVEDEKRAAPIRLFRVGVKDRKVIRLTENTDRIESLAISPEGKYAVTLHGRSLRYTYDNKIKPIVLLTELEHGRNRQIFTDPKLNIQHFAWSFDGKGIYASDLHSSKPQFAQGGVTEMVYYDLANDSVRKVNLDWERGLSPQVENHSVEGFVIAPHGFVALLAEGVRNRVARYTEGPNHSWKREWLTGSHVNNTFGLALSKDGKTLVYAYSTAGTATQWYRAPLDNGKVGEGKRLTRLNEEFTDRPSPKVEIIRWKGARDEEVEGLLYYPFDYKKDRKYPLVVMIHGGPAGADQDNWDESWAYAATLFCQRGALVFKPNYHGSSSYGLAWVESITNGKYYDLEIPDIEKGVDTLIGKGLVDADKLGVMGWSNGSILTVALTVHSARYKAASAGAGDVDWVSDWGNCEFGAAFDAFYFGKSVLEDPQTYIKKSPFYKLDKVKTPTLICFGTEDRVVPTQQGWMHYRALQQHGKADVRFLLFPGEQHSLKKLVHQKRKLNEELRWFDKHLFKTYKEENLALKEDSPLAWALKRQTAQQVNGRFGVLVKNTLIPEIVPYSGHQIGRFEVTAAQYAQFERSYKIEPGKENYPAAEIPFEQAKRYCAWLSKLTGDTYRLPNPEEAEDLYTGVEETYENTLDHWAGYEVNPDDARRLREKLKELGPGAPLLSAVGRFKGLGKEAAVFDLGGNVSEWVVEPSGKGVVRGGSADIPADAKGSDLAPSPAYIGFRVLKDKR